MSTNSLKIYSVKIERPLQEEITAVGSKARMGVAVEVENSSGAARHVWASPRAYDYDPASKVLTLHMSEQAFVVPPGIIMISDHPRAPALVEVPASGRATITVRIPPIIRRRSPDGIGWFEDPIGEIANVAVDVQHADTPIQSPRPHETGAQFRSRMLEHGAVAKATLTPSLEEQAPPAQMEK